MFERLGKTKKRSSYYCRTWQTLTVGLCGTWWEWSNNELAWGSERNVAHWLVDLNKVNFWHERWRAFDMVVEDGLNLNMSHLKQVYSCSSQTGHHLLVRGSSTTCLSGPGGRPRWFWWSTESSFLFFNLPLGFQYFIALRELHSYTL